jgi:hypothetical protein
MTAAGIPVIHQQLSGAPPVDCARRHSHKRTVHRSSTSGLMRIFMATWLSSSW